MRCIIGDMEFDNLRTAKKEAIRIAKATKEEVLITCLHIPSYKQDWFTMLPDGTFLTNGKGLSFNS